MINPEVSVLIVDDLPSVCNIVKRQLANKHITETNAAKSIKEAIGLLENKTYSVIISDLHIGSERVDDLLIFLKNQNKKTPVIVITSDMSREEFDEIKKLGISGYLLKPFSAAELIKIIGNTISLEAR